MRRPILLALALALALLAPSSGRAQPANPWPAGVHLPAGEPVSEAYRVEFDRCDKEGTFRGHASRYTRCADDPNAVAALRRLPGGAIAFSSKLAVDLDGSAFACGPRHGRMDQCPTSLMLPDGRGGEVPVDSDTVPYVVIPEAGPADAAGEFTALTGVRVGDFGVVIARGRVVPVIVADTGPFSKLGEGSLALHRALGNENCVTRDAAGVCDRVDNEGSGITAHVVTVLFPGSARPGLTPATIGAVTRAEGLRRWDAFRRRTGAAVAARRR